MIDLASRWDHVEGLKHVPSNHSIMSPTTKKLAKETIVIGCCGDVAAAVWDFNSFMVEVSRGWLGCMGLFC